MIIMISEKQFETTIETKNPVAFTVSKKENILIKLNERFLNKCYGNSFILSIKKIVYTSEVKCRLLGGISYIDVSFIAIVSYIKIWDIIIGAKIGTKMELSVDNDNGEDTYFSAIKDDNEEVNILIKPVNLNSSVKEGQMVPLRIIDVKHVPLSRSIVICGVLLTCDEDILTYKVEGKVEFNDIIRILIDTIVQQYKKRDALIDASQNNAPKIKFFESLVYYKKTLEEGKGKYFEIDNNLNYLNFGSESNVNLLSIKDGDDMTGYWVRPATVCKSSPFAKKMDEYKSDNFHSLSATKLYIDMLNNVYQYVTAINNFLYYYDDNLIQSHLNIWNMMRSKQINN